MIITARRHRAIQTDLRRNTYYRSLPKIKIKKSGLVWLLLMMWPVESTPGRDRHAETTAAAIVNIISGGKYNIKPLLLLL
jgi:hypothetical protein